MTQNRYTIRTVEDFFSVTQDKLKPLMLDFIDVLSIGFSTRPDDALRMDRSFFTLIDDGETGLSEVKIVLAQTTNVVVE